jgi:hypothetical protein
MKEDAKTPHDCGMAWALEFLTGTMTPTEHHKKMMTACKACSHYDECFPPYEKMDERTKAMYDTVARSMFEESMGK